MVKTLLIYFDIAIATLVATAVATVVDTDIATKITTGIVIAVGTEFAVEVATTVAISIATCAASNIVTDVTIDVSTDIATGIATEVPMAALDTYIYNVRGSNPHTGCQISRYSTSFVWLEPWLWSWLELHHQVQSPIDKQLKLSYKLRWYKIEKTSKVSDVTC